MKTSGKGICLKLMVPLALVALLLGTATAVGHGRHFGWAHAHPRPHRWIPAHHAHSWARPHARPAIRRHPVAQRARRVHVLRRRHYIAAGSRFIHTQVRRTFRRTLRRELRRLEARQRGRGAKNRRSHHLHTRGGPHAKQPQATTLRTALIVAYRRALRRAYTLAERLARQAFVAHHAQHLQGHADRASQAGGVTTDALSLGGHTVPVSGAQGIQSGIGGALAISPGRAVTPGQASNSPSAVGSSGVPLRGALAAITPGTASTRAAQTTSTKARPAKSATSTRHAATPHRPLEPPSVIQRIERVVPGFVWLALGISAALAALGGGAMFWSGYRMRSQAGEFAAVAAAALTDPLTGVLNRRGFIDAAERELSRARRYDRPFVLAYVDVRGLKAVNDSEGHQAGDRLLTAAAQLLRESARADDVVGRLGGDEMGVLLVEQSGEGAQPVIDRIHKTVAARRSEVGLRSPWDLTIGTATYPTDGKTVKELLATADRRLYEQRGIALT